MSDVKTLLDQENDPDFDSVVRLLDGSDDVAVTVASYGEYTVALRRWYTGEVVAVVPEEQSADPRECWNMPEAVLRQVWGAPVQRDMMFQMLVANVQRDQEYPPKTEDEARDEAARFYANENKR